MAGAINPQMTLRQVVRSFPKAEAVLAPYAAARVGKTWSVQELGAFAHTINVPEKTLLQQLSAATGAPTEPAPIANKAGTSAVATMLTALLISLTLGAGWGVYLLLSISVFASYEAAPGQWVHVHGIEQLWGWVGLTIFAVASYLLHQAAKVHPPAWLGVVLRSAILVGLVLFAVTLVVGPGVLGGWIAVAASSLLLIAALCFTLDMIWSLSGRNLDAGLLFVLVALQWLLVWAAADVTIRWFFRGQPVPSGDARKLLIELPVLGFFTNMIFGFGIRLIPGFLNITKLRHRAFLVALPIYNCGLIAFLAAPPLQRIGLHALLAAWLGIAAAATMLFGALVYITGLHFFRPTQPVRPIHGVDPRGGILIPIAFSWLIISLIMILIERMAIAVNMPLAHPLAGAYRHALTVGFVTTMILAVGHRLAPVFIRQELVTTRAFMLSAVLIVVGCFWRVSCELWTLGGSPLAYRLMGVSGLLELAAIGLFALTIFRTLRASRRHYRPGERITPGTRVKDAVNAYPELQQTLLDLGIDMFAQAAFIAPSMRVGGLALGCSMQPLELAAKLNAAVAHTPARANASV